MGFYNKIQEDILVACARHCCVCHRYVGVKVEIHHIKPKAQGGQDTFENAIPLCYNCHSDAGHYFANHPKGTKFSPQELKKHREAWFNIVKENKIPIIDENYFTTTNYIENQNGTLNIYIDGEKYLWNEIPALKKKLVQYEKTIESHMVDIYELKQDKNDMRERIAELKIMIEKTVLERNKFEEKYQKAIQDLSQFKNSKDTIYQQALGLFLGLHLDESLKLLKSVTHDLAISQTLSQHKDLAQQAHLKAKIYSLQNENVNVAYNDMLLHYNIVLSIDKKDWESYFYRGLANGALNQKEAAILDYDQMIVLNPTYIEPYVNRGNAKSLLKQYDNAILDYDHAIQLNPQSIFAYIGRGNAKVELGQMKSAISDFDKVIATDVNYVEAYMNRGNVNYALKEYELAILDYNQVIALNLNEAKAYNNLGNAKYLIGKRDDAIVFYEKAILDYGKAIELNPNYSEGYCNRGIIKAALNQHKSAILDYDKSLELNPNYVDAYNHRGNSKAALGEKKFSICAILDYDKAIALNPKYAIVYYNRGNVKYTLNQIELAILDYDKVIQLKPNDAVIYAYNQRGLAKIALNINQIESAISDYNRAIEINPNHGDAYYNKSCAYSLWQNKSQSLYFLKYAISLDKKYKTIAKKDPDFLQIIGEKYD